MLIMELCVRVWYWSPCSSNNIFGVITVLLEINKYVDEASARTPADQFPENFQVNLCSNFVYDCTTRSACHTVLERQTRKKNI